MTAHSLIPMSGASVWRECSAQPLLAAMYPKAETDGSKEGTAAHELGQTFIELSARALPYPDHASVVGKPSSNGVLIDDTMYESATVYADHCRSIMVKTGNFAPWVEKTLSAPSIHPEAYGTFDFALYDKTNGVIYLRDFKYGFLAVEVFESWQLIGYMCAIADHLGIDGANDQHIMCDMGIVQPRAYHRHGPIRTWRISLASLRGYFNQLTNAAAEVFSPNTKTVTGLHCMYCPARASCPALQKVAQAVVQAVDSSMPEDLTPSSLGVELAILEKASKLLEARITGLKSQAETLIRAGENVSNYRLQQVPGRLKWNVPDEQVFVLGELCGQSLKKESAITPTQAIEKGMSRELVEMNSVKPTSLKLTFDDGNDARYFFTNGVN